MFFCFYEEHSELCDGKKRKTDRKKLGKKLNKKLFEENLNRFLVLNRRLTSEKMLFFL